LQEIGKEDCKMAILKKIIPAAIFGVGCEENAK
jgi:hypothetical protein